MKIMMTGSRKWTDEKTIKSALSTLVALHGPYTLLCGGASGADALAEKIGNEIDGVTVSRVPADWNMHDDNCWCGRAGLDYCRMAGFRRNQEMIDMKPSQVIAFWFNKSSGTKDAIDRAKKAGIPVHVYES